MAETYLKYQPVQKETLVGKGKSQIKFEEVELARQAEFVVEEADLVFQLKQQFEKELVDNKLSKLYTAIEIPLLQVFS